MWKGKQIFSFIFQTHNLGSVGRNVCESEKIFNVTLANIFIEQVHLREKL